MEIIAGTTASGKSIEAVHRLVRDKEMCMFVVDGSYVQEIVEIIKHIFPHLTANELSAIQKRIVVSDRRIRDNIFKLRRNGIKRVFIDDLDRCIENMFYPLEVAGFTISVSHPPILLTKKLEE